MCSGIEIIDRRDLRNRLTGLSACHQYIDLMSSGYSSNVVTGVLGHLFQRSKSTLSRLPVESIIETLIVDNFHDGYTIDFRYSCLDADTTLSNLCKFNFTGKLSGLLQCIHNRTDHIHKQAAICLIPSQLSFCKDVLQHSEYLCLGISRNSGLAVISLCLLCHLCHTGEEQGICLRHYLSLFEGSGDILHGCSCVGLIHICLVYQELNVSVMGYCKWNICLIEGSHVPTTGSLVILITSGARLCKVECLRIQPSYIRCNEGRC